MGLDLSALDGGLVWDRPVAPDGVASRAPLAAFDIDAENPRFEADSAAFEALVANIAEHGILQPIVVRRLASGRLRILFGERRYRAAVLLRLDEAPYVVTDDERQFSDYAQVAENQQRSSLQPLELATFIAKKLAQGERKKVLASRLRIDPSAVTHLLALTGDVPSCLLELYHARRCRWPAHIYELRKLFEREPELVALRCSGAAAIDRRFIDALVLEVGPAAGARRGGSIAATSLVPDTLTVANTKSAMAGGAGAPENESENCIAGDERKGSAGDKPLRLKVLRRPELHGTYRGRDIVVLIAYRPSTPESVLVRFDDDASSVEVPLDEITLTRLGEVRRERGDRVVKPHAVKKLN